MGYDASGDGGALRVMDLAERGVLVQVPYDSFLTV